MNTHLKLFCDGGSRGNPGPSALGAVLYDGEKVVAEISEYLGVGTNNQAEYRALIAGLTRAKVLGARTLDCALDSELIVKQLKGEYRVKDAILKQYFMEVKKLIAAFDRVVIRHVFREHNKYADRLVNATLDAQ